MEINWAQVLFNSVVTGSLYLIGAVGLTLTYGLSSFPNFAYAEFMTLGAFMGFVVAHQLGFDFSFAFIAAFLVSGILGALTYQGIFRFLANRGRPKSTSR
jgi:branched-subunit amino acid ABC-type transport system permease component